MTDTNIWARNEACMRKNPQFDYKAFSLKREQMIHALRDLEDDEDDASALSVLQDAINDNVDTIEYLKYMTPFYKQVVASRFRDMSEVDWEVCEYAAERVLNVDREDDEIFISWVFEKVRELYTYCGDIVLTVLSDLRTEYIRQNPTLDPSLVFDFGREPLDRLDADSVSLWEYEDDEIDTRHFQALWVDIESQIGYLGVVYAFLNTANLEYSGLWPFTNLVYVRYDHRLNKDHTFNMHTMYESVKDCVTGDDTEGHGGFVPMWMINTVHSMDFYCESIHLTPSKSGRYAKGSLDVTPKTLQTKLSDYKSAAWATYGRDLPLVTSASASRGLVFSWSEYILCQGGFKQTRNNLDSLFFAGENCIFLFSKANVTLCRETDFALETVSLLSAVEETIPCIVEYVHPEHIAFIGQQGDLPILVIDESDDPPRPFVCYVLSELRKYLLSDEYRASDNLNSVPVLPATQVDAYLAESKRPNPYIGTNRYGYLLNPQYSEWARAYESRRGEGDTTLWVHATENDVSDWLDPNFKIKGDRFYIGGGANADLFGQNLVFVKYKPTNIFDYADEYRDDNDFLECVYQELTSLPHEDKDEFIDVHAKLMDEPEDNLPTFDDLSKPQIIELFKSGLATSNYSFFENSYVQKCLVKFGYTAYYESEGYGGVSTAWEDINLAILPADFDNLEIVGVALCTDQEKGYYECPNCQYRMCSKKEILEGTFYKGTVLCEDCSKGAECSICDKLTPESSVEVEEYDSWGDRSIICISCVEDRRCEYCEEFFDSSEIRPAKRTKSVPGYSSYVERTVICDGCFEENREDFDEVQDPRPNPSRERC